MYYNPSLLDKTTHTKYESFTITDEYGALHSYFSIRHDRLNKHSLEYDIKSVFNSVSDKNITITPLDDYSPNMLVLIRSNNTIKKYIVYKS